MTIPRRLPSDRHAEPRTTWGVAELGFAAYADDTSVVAAAVPAHAKGVTSDVPRAARCRA